MKLFKWREKTWWQRGVLILTVVVVVILASHPELRLFLPLVDALGLDLLLFLMGAQFLDYVRPWVAMAHRYVVQNHVFRLHSLFLLFFYNVGFHKQSQRGFGATT